MMRIIAGKCDFPSAVRLKKRLFQSKAIVIEEPKATTPLEGSGAGANYARPLRG